MPMGTDGAVRGRSSRSKVRPVKNRKPVEVGKVGEPGKPKCVAAEKDGGEGHKRLKTGLAGGFPGSPTLSTLTTLSNFRGRTSGGKTGP